MLQRAITHKNRHKVGFIFVVVSVPLDGNLCHSKQSFKRGINRIADFTIRVTIFAFSHSFTETIIVKNIDIPESFQNSKTALVAVGIRAKVFRHIVKKCVLI
jgi:hypothetical protein